MLTDTAEKESRKGKSEMSTKKKEAAKKPAEKTLTLRDGSNAPRVGCFVRSEADGKFERASAETVAKSTCFAMTVLDAKGREVTTLATVERTAGGNFSFTIPAASSLVTTVRREKEPGSLALPNGVTHVGRGEMTLAAWLLGECWRAYGDNFGLAKAYRAVDCHLSVKDGAAWWKATFASALDLVR